MLFRFGPYVADRTAYRVWSADEPLDLTPKLLDLLFHFLEHPAALVTKEELLDAVWPAANVTENALAQAMSELREALGDSATAPTYIRTVARRGYRFIAPVERVDEPVSAPAFPAPPPARPGSDPRQAIVVTDFTNVTGEPDSAWLSAGIAETVTNDLARLDHFRVIDRRRATQAAREHDSAPSLGRAVGATLVVTGSFQRLGAHLRITARVMDVETGETLTDAKIDGPIESVFELQDEIVSSFARALGIPRPHHQARVGVRETSNLEAYRAFTEGLLKIESLDTSLVRSAIADFERAIADDSGYAMAYAGLASARFVAFETTRAGPVPDHAALTSGIEDARRAIALDRDLAEAHATLSFLLVSASAFEEARTAAHRAVALEPESWRHQYRLGHALWGTARVRALERALALHPHFAFATLETAMLHVARGDLAAAERLVRRQMDDPAPSANRFPGVGFRWFLGALEAEGGRHESALAAFAQEGSSLALRRLYGPEYAAEARAGAGFSLLALGSPDRALASFREAQQHVERHPRGLIGEALACEALSRKTEAGRLWTRAETVPGELTNTGRPHQGRLTLGLLESARGRPDRAVTALQDLFSHLPPCYIGWTIPIEPLLAGPRATGSLASVLARLAERAR